MSESKKSQSFKNLDDWLCYLEQIHNTEIELGLNRIKSVAAKMGLLEHSAKIILVAGTNGKGTTARCLESLLQAHQRSVGVYSSPHINHYNERVRVNSAVLSDSIHIKAFEFIEQSRGDTSLTYFEYSTLAALHIFKEANLDYIVLEVGLGGRLDATNIIEPDLSVITTIGIDHIDWLGDDREKIGFEKAGVFRSHKPAVIGELDCPASVREHATLINANAVYVKQDYHYQQLSTQMWQYEQDSILLSELPVPSIPVQNAATAITSLIQLGESLKEDLVRRCLSELTMEGRCQKIASAPDFYIDVAHNPQSSSYLANKILELKTFEGQKVIGLVAMLSDKDIENTLLPLCDVVDEWLVAALDVPRGEKTPRLVNYLSDNSTKLIKDFESIQSAYLFALENAEKNDLIIGFGSFFTVSEILNSNQ